MNQSPSHPPRPGVRRYVDESRLTTEVERAVFAASVRAIEKCGLSAEVIANTDGAPRFTLYATRRVRTFSDEKR